MEHIAITKKARSEITDICKATIAIEYEILLGYPKIVDHLRKFEDSPDSSLLTNYDLLGKESLKHYTIIDELIRKLGSEMTIVSSIPPQIEDIVNYARTLLEKEKTTRDLYVSARNIAKNKEKIVKRGRLFNLFRANNESASESSFINQITLKFDSIIKEKEFHIELAKKSLETLRRMPADSIDSLDSQQMREHL